MDGQIFWIIGIVALAIIFVVCGRLWLKTRREEKLLEAKNKGFEVETTKNSFWKRLTGSGKYAYTVKHKARPQTETPPSPAQIEAPELRKLNFEPKIEKPETKNKTPETNNALLKLAAEIDWTVPAGFSPDRYFADTIADDFTLYSFDLNKENNVYRVNTEDKNYIEQGFIKLGEIDEETDLCVEFATNTYWVVYADGEAEEI